MFANDRALSAALDRHLEPPDPGDDSELYDFDGRCITIGMRVRYFDFDPHHPDWPGAASSYVGEVVEITDWDGDVDDEGRSYGIPPAVVVKFADGSRESYGTSEWDCYGTTGKVEELCAIAAPEVGHVRLRRGRMLRQCQPSRTSSR